MNKTAMITGLSGVVLAGAVAMAAPYVVEHITEEKQLDQPIYQNSSSVMVETVTQSQSQSTLRNVMYYSDWSIWGGQGNFYPQDLPTHLYTHLNFCFLDFDSAGNLMFTDTDAAVGASLNQEGVTWGDVNAGILPVLRSERMANPNMKLGISVGGWSKSGDFSTMAGNDTTRATFVSNMMKFLEYTDMDFIDIDWEYPAVVRQPDYTDNSLDEGTPAASPADKGNYIKLLQELRVAMDAQGQRLGKTYELSVALPMSQEKLEAGVDIPAMFDVVDFANIMTYDARGAFDDVSGHHSPLYGNPADPFYDKGYSVDQSVKYLLKEGAQSEKIVIGVAFYSRGWENIQNTQIVSGLPGLFAAAGTGTPNADSSSSTGALNDMPLAMGEGGMAGGVWAYRNFGNLKATYPNLVEYWDDVAKAPYLYNGSAFFTYDNPQSITAKANYVRENNLGGIITWQSSNDSVTDTPNQRDELTKVIYNGLYQGGSLPSHFVTTAPLDVDVALTTTSGGLQITLTNKERAEETTAVLRAVELQKETIQLPTLYLDCGGKVLESGGYGSGTVSQENGLTKVVLSDVYDNKLISHSQSLTFTLKYSDTSITPSTDHVTSMVLTQQSSTSAPVFSSQVIYGNSSGTLPNTDSNSGNQNGNQSGNQSGSNGSTSETPSVTTPEAEQPQVTVPSSGVLSWNRSDEAAGVYVPNTTVSYKGNIYQQVAETTLWWDEPSPTSTGWKLIGTDENYVAEAPSGWNREAEAVGTYVVGSVVTHNGRTYQQVGDATAWWCEPGTNEEIWKEI